jgi:hypothetical protein
MANCNWQTSSANERLKEFLNEGGNWERKATNIPGVFLFRLPASKGKPASLAIEINPDDTYGSITKKRGVLLLQNWMKLAVF